MNQGVPAGSLWDTGGAVFCTDPPILMGTSQCCCNSHRAMLQRRGERSVNNGLALESC